jgi:hypothetical protein
MCAAPVIRGVSVGLVLSLTFAGAASAQRRALREVKEWGVAGFSGAVALEEVSRTGPVATAGGGGLFMNVALDPFGLLGLRLEGSILAYGRDGTITYTNPYNSHTLQVSRNTFLTGFHAGPQVTLGRGILRPYGFGTVGFSYLFSTTSLDYCDCIIDDDASLEEFDWSAELGAGLMLRLGGSSSNFHLDVGARFLYGADAEFAASSTGNPTSPFFQREASVSVMYLGFSFGLKN